MAKPTPVVLLRAATRYLKTHPEQIVRAVKDAAGMRLSIPLDTLRYFANRLGSGKWAPKDVAIEARPPGLGLSMTVRLMGSDLRVGLTLFVESFNVADGRALVRLRMADMDLEAPPGGKSPITGLIKSGALDLSKPGNLVAHMPNRPDALVDAEDDWMMIDLMKIPRLAKSARFQRALGILSPLLSVAAIRTRGDYLYVQLKASPSRFREALAAASSAA